MSLNSDGTALMGRGLLVPSFAGEEDDGGGGLALPGTTVMTPVGLAPAPFAGEDSSPFSFLEATTIGIRRVVEAVETVAEVALVETESWKNRHNQRFLMTNVLIVSLSTVKK